MKSLRVLAILATATFLFGCGENAPAPAEAPPAAEARRRLKLRRRNRRRLKLLLPSQLRLPRRNRVESLFSFEGHSGRLHGRGVFCFWGAANRR